MIWLWLLALTFFFWPQGVAVIELSRLYPGEGGVYRWTKELFGDFHGFISGWCYWTNNVFYVPSVLLYLVGVCVYVGGERAVGLLDHRLFVFLVSFGLLWLLAGLNVRGLAVGKWVNNLGGIGTVVAATALVGLAMCVMHAHAATLPLSSFSPRGADWRLLSTFGVICFGLVGLELGSAMGDEILNPQHTVPSAVLWGGVISGVILVATTLFRSGKSGWCTASSRPSAAWPPRPVSDGSCPCSRSCSRFRPRALPRRGSRARRASPLLPVSIATCRRRWARSTRATPRLTSL